MRLRERTLARMLKQTLLVLVRGSSPRWPTPLNRPTKSPCACSKQFRISNQTCRSSSLSQSLAVFKTNNSNRPNIKKWQYKQMNPLEKVQPIINKATTRRAKKRKNLTNEERVHKKK